MSVINTNLASLRAQLAVRAADRASGQVMEELATGKRINSAADDAAGMAIRSRMTAQIQGMDQAIRNIMDGGSMLQAAEGSAVEISAMLQRMRELAVQSLNGTMTEADRDSLDLEFQQLKRQIDTIANSTEWNGELLLNLRAAVESTAVAAVRTGQGPLDTSVLPTGTYKLFINGVEVPIAFVKDELPDARLGKIINAIQSSRDLHGAVADLSGDGSLSLSTPDGRDLAVWYDSNVSGLSAESFGLGRAGAVSQVNEISITASANNGQPVENRQSTYVEYSNPSSGSLTLSTSNTADNTLGQISVVGNTVYRGLGGSAQAFGVIDSVKNGQAGQALRINYLTPFVNGSFESGTVGSSTVPGWSVYPQRVKLDGTDTIAGYPTPIDNRPESGSYIDISNSYTAALSNTSVAPGSTQSMMLKSTGLVVDAFGVSHGPYIVSDNLYVPAGQSVSFKWRATGDTDTFDIYAYLLNTETGQTTTLLNRTGTSLSDSTSWTTASTLIGTGGTYKFVFVAGSYDFSGGRATGATLFVDDVQVSGSPPSQGPSSADLDDLYGLLQFAGSGSNLQASFSLQGQTIASGTASSSSQALTQLKQQIDTLTEQGLMRGVSADISHGKLRLSSIYPGRPLNVGPVSVSNAAYTAQQQLITASQPGVERATAIAGASVNSTGAEITSGVPADSDRLRTAGQLRYQVGANQGDIIEYAFADFTGENGMLDALTWDTSSTRLSRALAIAVATGQAAVNDSGQVRSSLLDTESASRCLQLIDQMLQEVDGRRALLGAAMNRLEAAGNNLGVGFVQQSMSRSAIEDTDYAQAASDLAKTSIIKDAATAVLVQANMSNQDILKLLDP
jgi:flagellin-like hook-associated protein FlgL